MLQPLDPDTDAQLHEERVISVRKKPNLHLEFYQRDVTGGMQTPWKLLVDVMSKSFQEVIKVQRMMIQKVIHSKVQNTVDARLRADSSAVARCNDADFEQTTAQSIVSMLQISNRRA